MKKNQMIYKGYTGSIEWSEPDNLFYGKILGIRSLVLYDGENLEDLKKDFHEAIDFYLDSCIEEGIKPEKPFSGSFNVRISPKIHQLAVEEAYEKDTSLNSIVSAALKAFLM